MPGCLNGWICAVFATTPVAADPQPRCGTHSPDRDAPALRGDAGDCSGTHTNPAVRYAPQTQRFRIPVVFHVIRNGAGTLGHLSPELIQSQMDVTNEDFLALAGTPGGLGAPCEIEFYLADVDPEGNSTTGITYTDTNLWFDLADAELYDAAAALAWDAARYLNVYTARLSDGYIGYVTAFPWEPLANTAGDAVVLDYRYVGRSGPEPPYHLGRGVTHEVGHYLGLYHTFEGGCGPNAAPGCYNDNDLICDTEPMTSPTFGCPTNRNTCGGAGSPPDPFRNYMDYTNDGCMTNFTAEQARRMRCAWSISGRCWPECAIAMETAWRMMLTSRATPALIATAIECRMSANAGDLNGDCQVNLGDLTRLLSNFGDASGATYRDGDVNRDGEVGIDDLVVLLSRFGTPCGE